MNFKLDSLKAAIDDLNNSHEIELSNFKHRTNINSTNYSNNITKYEEETQNFALSDTGFLESTLSEISGPFETLSKNLPEIKSHQSIIEKNSIKAFADKAETDTRESLSNASYKYISNKVIELSNLNVAELFKIPNLKVLVLLGVGIVGAIWLILILLKINPIINIILGIIVGGIFTATSYKLWKNRVGLYFEYLILASEYKTLKPVQSHAESIAIQKGLEELNYKITQLTNTQTWIPAIDAKYRSKLESLVVNYTSKLNELIKSIEETHSTAIDDCRDRLATISAKRKTSVDSYNAVLKDANDKK